MPTTRENHSTDAAQCRVCGEAINTDNLECPLCGAVQEFDPRRRREGNRPRRFEQSVARSQNHNGLYTIYRNSDGSYSCTCPSFMKGNSEVRPGWPGYSCKHIRNYLDGSAGAPEINGRPPTEWQSAALKKLGVAGPERLTDAQAYFLIQDILDYQGVSYREYEAILRDHGRVSVLPVLPVGVEFEGYVSAEAGHQGLAGRLVQAGIPAIDPGYTHNQFEAADGRPMFKLVPDASLSNGVSGWTPVEIVTPKLFGAKGFKTVGQALAIWREAGAKVTASTGCHVHVDAWNYEDRLLIELMKLWARIESRVLWWFVSPSRRGNSFCLPVTADYIRMAARQGVTSVTRYLSLNVKAFESYRTVEFRLHQGTTSGRKIIPWVIFLMKLVEAVKNGLTWRDVEPTPDSVFDAVGMDETATPRIRRARDFLGQRYEWWRRDAERNPTHARRPVEVDLDTVEREIERIVSGPGRARTPVGEDILRRRMTIRALAGMRGRSREEVIENPDAGFYHVRSVTGSRMYLVTRSGGVLNEDDSLRCSCPSFTRDGRCVHAIGVARALMRVVEARRAEESSAAAARR
ncbi:MAG: amidoligase family protein [Candidatus Nitrospinota bacterium M3_3B_026]